MKEQEIKEEEQREDSPWMEDDKPVKVDFTSLEQVTAEMGRVMDYLSALIPKLNDLEDEYYRTYYKYLLQGGESTQATREASAKLQARMTTPEGEPSVYDDYQEHKTDVRVLLTRKECLIEISRNLRTITNAQSR